RPRDRRRDEHLDRRRGHVLTWEGAGAPAPAPATGQDFGITMRFAVTVEPFFAPAIPTSSPVFTALLSVFCPCCTTRSGSPNVHVEVNPSVDFTVTVVSVTAVTVPRCTSTVLSPFFVCTTTSPCSTWRASSRRSLPGRSACGRAAAPAEADGAGSAAGVRSSLAKPT